MKIVINDVKSGQSFQKEVDKTREPQFYGKKIGDVLEGSIVGLDGYKLKITGGSNKDGVPMRRDIGGTRRVKAILSKGPGVRGLKKGGRKKKSVVGCVVSPEIIQLNAAVTEYGSKPLAELGFVAKEKEKKKEEKEEKKPEKKEAEKKEEKEEAVKA